MAESLAEIVLKHFPDANSDDIVQFIWGCTAFPFAGTGEDGMGHYESQLKELAEASGGDISKAFEINDRRIEEAMKNSLANYCPTCDGKRYLEHGTNLIVNCPDCNSANPKKDIP